MTPKARRVAPGVNTELAKPTWLPASAVSAICCSVRPFTAGKSAAVAVDAAASSVAKSFFDTPGGGWGAAEPEPPQPAASSAAAAPSARARERRIVTPEQGSGGPVGSASAPSRGSGRLAAALHADALQHVRDVLAGVDGRFERLEDVLPADHDHRIDAGDEERWDRVAAQAVALVLQAMDLDEVRPELGARAQRPQRGAHLVAGGDEDLGEQAGVLHRGLDAVQAQHVGGLLGVVDDVVEGSRELQALERVERLARRAAVVQAVDDVVGDPVAVVLAVDELGRELG